MLTCARKYTAATDTCLCWSFLWVLLVVLCVCSLWLKKNKLSDLISVRPGSSEVVEFLEDGVLFLDTETTQSWGQPKENMFQYAAFKLQREPSVVYFQQTSGFNHDRCDQFNWMDWLTDLKRGQRANAIPLPRLLLANVLSQENEKHDVRSRLTQQLEVENWTVFHTFG